ncbi:MAG: class I adenylate-forming enzyme family protein [Pseudohongiellaceae bacterium]
MLSDAELRRDLAQLKDIAAAHKAPGQPLATHRETIAGQACDVFSHIPGNLGELYELGLARAELDFLVYQDERFTFAESLDRARRLGRILMERYGIRRGDRVAVCARNSPEWCLTYMGVTLIGAIIVPMNSWWRGPELEYGLRDSGSRLLFADAARREQVAPYLAPLGIEVVCIKPAEPAPDEPEFYSLLDGVAPLTPTEIAALAVRADDDASIMYTSGSTGEPKGVLSSHRAILSALYTWKFVREINEILRPELVEENPEFEPAILCNVPLFHVTGSHAQFLASFVNQRKFVMMYKWDADRALELIEAERISVFHGVPTMTWELMHAKGFARTDLSSLRSVQSGGAPRPPEHLALMLRSFPDKALPGLGYGLTETNAIGAIITGKFYEARPNSTGRPSPPVTEVRIAGDDGEALPGGEIGEICIRGPSLMKGYWNKPEATAEAIRGGWFHTGDVGMLDELGFLIILDRAKDIVIRGGENIGCAEVEYALSEHPAVAEVSVYGIPDTRLGEVPVATVMLKPGASVGEQALKDFLVERIAPFKIPHLIRFQTTQLPRLATGKIAKKLLRLETLESLGSLESLADT